MGCLGDHAIAHNQMCLFLQTIFLAFRWPTGQFWTPLGIVLMVITPSPTHNRVIPHHGNVMFFHDCSLIFKAFVNSNEYADEIISIQDYWMNEHVNSYH